MSPGKDIVVKFTINLKNPTRRQFLSICNLMFTCRTNLTEHAIAINDVYKSTDFLQNVEATRILSEHNISDDILTIIKKPYPYKLE
jgi:hypothetical protein